MAGMLAGGEAGGFYTTRAGGVVYGNRGELDYTEVPSLGIPHWFPTLVHPVVPRCDSECNEIEGLHVEYEPIRCL